MGDDDFTRGKPHPMIDLTLRNQRLINELNDPQTAVVLFDVVLGYGASETLPVNYWSNLLTLINTMPRY
jgi:hypothetical protein